MLKYQIGNGAVGEGCAHGMTSSVPLTVLSEVQSLTMGSSAGCGWVPAHRLGSGTMPSPLPTNYCSALFFFFLFSRFISIFCVWVLPAYMSVPDGCPQSQKRASYVLELDTHVVQMILLAQAFQELWKL